MKSSIVAIALLFTATLCTKAQTNENIFSMKLGNSKAYLLSEGQGKGNATILIGATPEIKEKYAPDNSFPIATNAFLWQINGKNILFDTGNGKALFDNLQSLQIKPEDINAVFITHMHGDHIGGMLRNDKPAFPKATVYLSRAEYDYWTNENIINQLPENSREGFKAAKKVLDAYKSQLKLFVPDNIDAEIYKDDLPFGILAIAAYGHTPGHTVYLIGTVNDKLLVWGDLTHAMAVQMPNPGVAVTYDINSQQAVKSRADVLKLVANSPIPVAGMHIPYPGIGKIEKSGTGYRFVPAK